MPLKKYAEYPTESAQFKADFTFSVSAITLVKNKGQITIRIRIILVSAKAVDFFSNIASPIISK